MQTSICPVCHKEFSYFPSCYKGGIKYHCSRKCQSIDARIVTKCPACGKEFWYHQSWPRKYCSRKCSASVNAINNLGIFGKGEHPVSVECETCGKGFLKAFQDYKKTKHHFCSQECFGKYLSQTLKGVPRPEVCGEKPLLQKRVEKICPICHKKFEVKQSHSNRRVCCSLKCSTMNRLGRFSGENNPSWKGGPLPYYGPNWLQQRRNARYRDGYKCQNCGMTEKEAGQEHDVHHIRPFREFGIEQYVNANTLSNLITLCHRCHLIVEHEQNTRPSFTPRKSLYLPHSR